MHRSRSLDARDTTRHQGIPITTIARTLLDLAATTSQRTSRHRRPGATATADEDPKWTSNDFEAWFLQLVRNAGLPEPQVNLPPTAPDHPRLVPDFCWPTHRLIVETDGWDTHRTRAAFQNDRRRDAALQADGWRVLRFTWDEEPAVIQRRLQALLPG